MTKKISYAEILQFLPRFEAGEFADAREHYLEMGLEPQPVLDFMAALVHGGLQIPFDWPTWKTEAHRYRENPELIADADLATLKKLLTAFLRQDRFSGGHFAEMCASGIFVPIPRRLHALGAEYFHGQDTSL